MLSIPVLRPDESPEDRAQRLLDSLTHGLLAALLSASVAAIDGHKLTATAYDRRTKTRIVVRLVRYEGVVYEPAGRNSPASSPAGLREVPATIYEAAPGPNDKPISIRQLATRAGYRDTGWFRSHVNNLLDSGLLVRVRGGVRRAKFA